MVRFKMLAPVNPEDTLGFIPYMLNADNPTPAKEQLDKGYQHGGGWHPFPGFTMNDDLSISYPGDPPHKPLAEAMLRDEKIVVYESGWVAIVQPDKSFEICRMD